jgi:excisionase family DNA binding protein
MSVREAALALNVPEKTVYHWATHGTLPSVKIGGRRMLLAEGIKGAVAGEAA